MSYSSLDGSDSTISTTKVPSLDTLQMHHTQALVNIVTTTLHQTPINASHLTTALLSLRQHLELPRIYTHIHPLTETNTVTVLAHILLCWVCARASQSDAQNYSIDTIVETLDQRFDKYARVTEGAVSETVQCISCLTTMGAGVDVVAGTSIPASLVLLLSFTDNICVHEGVFRALTKMCASRYSVRNARANKRQTSNIGIHAVLDAFTRAQTALRLRNRFDAVANCLFTLVADLGCKVASQSDDILGLEQAVVGALAFVNSIVDAHSCVEERLRVRMELLDTPVYQAMKLIEARGIELPSIDAETRRFRRAYTNDIRACNRSKTNQ